MKLSIWRHREESESGIRFTVTCTLDLTWDERRLLKLYGTPPLTDPLLTPHMPGAPEPKPVLTRAELNELRTPPGLTRNEDDMRQAFAFIEKLTQGCRDLLAYWAAAEAFDGSETVPIDSTTGAVQ